MEIAEVQNLLREKDTKIREIEEALTVKGKLDYEAPYYWLKDGYKKDGPFCQKCYDADGKLIRLQKRKTQGSWGCMKCDKIFQDKNYREPVSPPIRGRLV